MQNDMPAMDAAAEKAPGRTVVVFICGTCSNQSDAKASEYYYDGNLIPSSYERTAGEPLIHKIIIDGPGSGEKDKHLLWVKYPKRGYGFYSGLMQGSGLQERLNHVIAVLCNDQTHTPPQAKEQADALQQYITTNPQYAAVRRVNVVGWSRGAVAAVKLARMMQEDKRLAHAEVNLLMLDPVPGPGLNPGEFAALSSNVNNCHIVVPYHERSGLFMPLLPVSHAACQIQYYFMPGNHAALIGNTLHQDDEANEGNIHTVSEVTRYLIQHFLHQYGTHLDPKAMLHIKVSDLLEWYGKIKKDEQTYEKWAIADVYTWSQWGGDQLGRPAVMQGRQIYLESFRKQHFPWNKDIYVDHQHERLACIVKLARDFAAKPIEIEQIESRISMLLSVTKDWHPAEGLLLIRAVSEDLMEKYHPDYLLDIGTRCQNAKELCCFMNFIAEIQIKQCQDRVRNQKVALHQELVQFVGNKTLSEQAQVAAKLRFEYLRACRQKMWDALDNDEPGSHERALMRMRS